VEGAQALQVPPSFLQPQVFRVEVHQIKAILDLLNRILLYRRHGGKLTRDFRVPSPGGLRDPSRHRVLPRGVQNGPMSDNDILWVNLSSKLRVVTSNSPNVHVHGR
jgi:hypothetical protein